MKNITLQMIADMAGVSKATVSRFINNSGYVSESTKKKIRAIIEQYNYLPATASEQTLPSNFPSTIGVIVPELNPFFTELLQYFHEIIERKGWNMAIYYTNGSMQKEKQVLQMLKQQNLKGILLAPSSDYNNFTQAHEFHSLMDSLPIPVVLIDRRVEHSRWDGVYLDNFGGAYQAVTALIEAGHTKIGIITGDLNIQVGRDRFQGYKSALRDHNLPLHPGYIYYSNFTVKGAYQEACRCLSSQDRPTAIFTCNVEGNVGFFKAVLERNIQIPREIAWFGFDKVDFMDLFNLKFSYVDYDRLNMAIESIKLLENRIQHPNVKQQELIIRPHLALGGSEYYIH